MFAIVVLKYEIQYIKTFQEAIPPLICRFSRGKFIICTNEIITIIEYFLHVCLIKNGNKWTLFTADPYILAVADEDGGLIILNTNSQGIKAVEQGTWRAQKCTRCYNN